MPQRLRTEGAAINALLRNLGASIGIAVLVSKLASNTQQAVAGYYQGLAGVRQNGMYADTRQYVANVLAIRARMR